MGYLCILFLFWVFAPFIIAFSAVAQLETLQTVAQSSVPLHHRGIICCMDSGLQSSSGKVPSLHNIVTYWPILRSLWDGLASTLALALFMSSLSDSVLGSL